MFVNIPLAAKEKMFWRFYSLVIDEINTYPSSPFKDNK